MSTEKLQIAERARKHKQEALTNLHQFIDEELLHKSYRSLNKNSSPGVDGKYWHNYSLESQFRIPELLVEFKSGKYRAPSIRRVHIQKGKIGTRPLGIPTIEDKILQESVRRILTPIYEEDFKDFSYGFRSGHSAHQAIDYMFKQVSFKGLHYIIDVERVMEVLPKRFEKYKLELHPDKTKIVNLNSKRGEGSRSFDFLGFTHYLGRSRKGKTILKRKTSSKKLTAAITKTQDWIKHNRHRSLNELIPDLNAKLRDYYNYYGITFNSKGINCYFKQVNRSLQFWLNRRGGKPVWNWDRFNKLVNDWMPMFKPIIYHSYQLAKPIYEEPYAGKPLVRVCGGAVR